MTENKSVLHVYRAITQGCRRLDVLTALSGSSRCMRGLQTPIAPSPASKRVPKFDKVLGSCLIIRH